MPLGVLMCKTDLLLKYKNRSKRMRDGNMCCSTYCRAGIVDAHNVAELQMAMVSSWHIFSVNSESEFSENIPEDT